jgi:hypothetical protein
LAAACVAAGLGLAACDQAIETAHEAQRDADKAARITASAGQPRATDALIDRVARTSPDNLNGLQTEVENQAKNPAALKEVVKQQSAEEDLKEAARLLEQALRPDLNAAVKSSLNAQAGVTSLRLAAEQYKRLQDKLSDLSRQAAILEDLAQTATRLGAQAEAIAARARTPASSDVDQARTAVEGRKGDVAKAQAEVTRLEKEIADRQARARQIYSQTEADFRAADGMKGQAAIDAGNKAMTARREADTLNAEAAVLESQLLKARSDLAMAQIGQKEAEAQLATATAGAESTGTWARQNADQINSLREQAKKIVTDPNGVADQYKKFSAAITALDADIKAAAAAAGTAQTKFEQAANDARAARQKVADYVNQVQAEGKDPLKAIAGDYRLQATLQWSAAAAADQAGRIQAAGFTAATIASSISSQVATAYKAASQSDDAKAPVAADGYKQAAVDAFNKAVTAATAGTSLSGPDTDRLKWIGFGLQAVANQGLVLVGDKAALDKAKAAAAEAVKINPAMEDQLRRLTTGI